MLAERIAPSQLTEMAAQGARLEGRVPAQALPRLAVQLAGGSEPLNVRVGFALDPGKRPLLHIEVEGTVALVCQRCLGPVSCPVHVDVELTAVPDEAATQELGDPFDSVLLDVADGALALRDAVEDEVLATLPLAPRHAQEECQPASAVEAGSAKAPADRQRPFADLAALMNRRGPDEE